jgi:hypothetical protein
MFGSTCHDGMMPCLAAVTGRWNNDEANANDSALFPGTAACQVSSLAGHSTYVIRVSWYDCCLVDDQWPSISHYSFTPFRWCI